MSNFQIALPASTGFIVTSRVSVGNVTQTLVIATPEIVLDAFRVSMATFVTKNVARAALEVHADKWTGDVTMVVKTDTTACIVC